MEYRVLGPLEVLDGSGHKLPLGGARQQSVLASLLLRAEQTVALERLIDELWEDPPETAARTVRVYVSRLRHELPAGVIESRPGGYTLLLDRDRLDLHTFEKTAGEGRLAVAGGDCERAAQLLREALGLWRGPALAGLPSEALRREAERLEELRLQVVEDRLEADLGLGRHHEVVPELQALVAEHPFRERPRAQLMLALYRSGRQTEALEAYQGARRTLVGELGIEPSAPLRELEQAVLRQDQSIAAPLRVEPAEPEPSSKEPAPRARCLQCRAELPAEGQFCPACGAPIVGEAAGEERKIVTVLFADLVDSSVVSGRLDPEDVRALLSPYFERVRSELERFGATIEKFIGDAVMALFGVPVAHEDDPERAVRAAFAIREAVAELNEQLAGDELHVRIAVNTGEAVVDLGKHPSAGEGLAVGDVINTCFRLQAAAPVDGVLVGETTYHSTTEAIDYRAVEAVQAKGKTEPVAAWEALAVREEPREGLVRHAPLVGRLQELDILLGALTRARERRTPQLVTLVGVPGIGKTRLVRELLATVEARPEPTSWRHGRCLPYGDGAAFAALVDMVKSEAGILATDPADEAAAKLRATVTAAVGESEADWLERQLGPVVGLEGEPSLGRNRRTESFAAWRRFFEALAQRGSLILVFEDLHWADDGLLDFIDELVEWVSGVPLLVLCTARPELFELRPDWGGGKRNAVTLSLSPLSTGETTELLRALLGDVALPEELETPLISHAGGNPLYAEEYARILADRALLWRSGELARAGEGELPLPESVKGIIAARIDALAPAEKAVLQHAAVVGKVLWLGAVVAVAHVPRAEAEQCLHALERKEFLRREPRSSVRGEVEYWFRHVLIRDVAYAQLPRGRRAVGHRAAARWVESLTRDREEHAELLAHHYASALELARATGDETGGLVEPARVALREAGDRTFALNAFAAAARFYESALELEPNREKADPQLLFSCAKASLRADHPDRDLLVEARDRLLLAGERKTAAEAEVLLGELTLMQGGDRDTASGHFGGAVKLLETAPPSRAKTYVLTSSSRFLMFVDENEAAIRVGSEALKMADELGLAELRAHALDNIGAARIDIGDRGGLEDLERSVAIAVEANSPESVRSYLNLGSTLANVGDLRAAFEFHAKGRQAAARFADAAGSHWFAAERIYEHYWRGEWDKAIELAERLIEEVEGGLPHRMEFDAWLGRAWIRLARGDLRGALDDARRSLEFARTMNDAQSMLPALALSARTFAAAARDREAVETVDELLADWVTPSLMLPSFWTADLAAALVILGRDKDLAAVSAAKMRTSWLDAAEPFVAGDFVRAAAVYSEIGSLPDEAYSRLKAAAQLRPEDAKPQLEHALEFHRHVRADACVREAEALAAARL